jgi:hypothetical protein
MSRTSTHCELRYTVAGRDAADVAFAALVGEATLDTQIVCTIDLDRTAPGDPTTAAISTA